MSLSTFVGILIILFTNAHTVFSFEREFTIEINAGAEECFFQDLRKGQFIDLDYQVISGGQGNLDISFSLTAPSGLPVLQDLKEAENSHRVEATEDGDYRMCWDNTFSHFSSKTVFFELVIEKEDDDSDPWNMDLANAGLPPNKLYEMKMQDMQDSMNRVRGSLTKIRHHQDSVRAFEARDRNVAESNFTRVNVWSMITIVVMIVVGLIQVVLVRSLFDERSRVHRLWKQRPRT